MFRCVSLNIWNNFRNTFRSKPKSLTWHMTLFLVISCTVNCGIWLYTVHWSYCTVYIQTMSIIRMHLSSTTWSTLITGPNPLNIYLFVWKYFQSFIGSNNEENFQWSKLIFFYWKISTRANKRIRTERIMFYVHRWYLEKGGDRKYLVRDRKEDLVRDLMWCSGESVALRTINIWEIRQVFLHRFFPSVFNSRTFALLIPKD